MFKNISARGLNIWEVLILTFFYVLLKFLLVIGLFDIIENSIEDPFLQIEFGEFISAFITVLLLILLFKRYFSVKENNYISYPNWKLLFLLVILVIGLRFIEDPFFRYKNILFNEPNINPDEIKSIGFSTDIVFKFIYTILLVPVFEELLFRKIIFKSLLIKYSNLWLAILISSILFSATHLSLRNAIPTLLFGITAAYIYYKTNNIWYPISFHILSNLLWFAIFINPKNYWILLEELNFNIGYWLVVIFGIGLIYLIIKQYQRLKVN
ncbi:MAG: type II CAAX endopeptidase family protein [Bacteroidota bacterium]